MSKASGGHPYAADLGYLAAFFPESRNHLLFDQRRFHGLAGNHPFIHQDFSQARLFLQGLYQIFMLDIAPFQEDFPQALVGILLVEMTPVVYQIDTQTAIVFHEHEDVLYGIDSLTGGQNDVPTGVTGIVDVIFKRRNAVQMRDHFRPAHVPKFV